MGLADDLEIWVDRMSREDMFARLKNTNIIVLPFKMVSSDMPLTVLEALSLGVPVITTRVDGLPELVNGGRGILVHPNRPEEIVEQMLLLYRNPNLAKEIGLRARGYIFQQPNWDQMYDKIKRISIEAVQSNPSYRQES
jgi:glycosyltransferase involved in cell wall biosynthesis